MNFITDSEQLILPEICADSSGTRIGHLNLRVADLDRATDFYCQLLGMTVTCYGPEIGLPTVFLAFGDYHHHIALHWSYRDARDAQPTEHGGLNHFGIVYPDEGSLAKAVSSILQHGISIDDARDHGSTLSIYLRDLDGNGIELYYDRPCSRWFDPTGHLIINPEPFNIGEWLKEVLYPIPGADVGQMSNLEVAVMQ